MPTERIDVRGVARLARLALSDDEIDDALNDFAWELGGSDDIHASAGYRRDLVRKLGRRVIEEAKKCSN